MLHSTYYKELGGSNGMGERVLSFSKEALKERKRNIYLLMLMMAIAIPLFAYYLVYLQNDGLIELDLFLIIICVVVFLLMLEMFVVSRIMIKKVSEMKLIVNETSLQRVGGKYQESINYADIQKVSVKRDKTNRILYIKISYNRRNIALSGFDDMNFLLMQLQVKVLDQSKIVEIKNKINWSSPLVTVVSFVLPLLGILLMMSLDLDIYEAFNLFIPLVLGVIFFFAKPVSKNAGARFRILEIVLSCVLIVCGLILIGAKLSLL